MVICCVDVGCTRENSVRSQYRVTSLGYILCEDDFRLYESGLISVDYDCASLYGFVERMYMEGVLWCGFGFSFDKSRIEYTLHNRQLRCSVPHNELSAQRSSLGKVGYVDLLHNVQALVGSKSKKMSLTSVLDRVSTLDKFFVEYRRFLVNYCVGSNHKLELHHPLSDAFACYYLLKLWRWGSE